MIFSSILFLFYFLPVFLIVYFILPKSFKNLAIFIGSLFFYAFGEPKYILIMLVEIFLSYFFALLIEKNRDRKSGLYLTVVSVILIVSFLLYFKYTNFFIDCFNGLTGSQLAFLDIVLPIGISFYTFQIISYTIDVYRGKCAVLHSFIKLGAYITMFPQLIAGPIVRYSDISLALDNRCLSIDKIAIGIKRFAIGLAKKVIVANTIGEIVALYPVVEHSVLFIWIFAISICLQLYFDFSGYSDMAIGLGHILGFDFPENFRHPFESRSVTEFWRRWHISLGNWFRDYIYIPLGGNRVSFLRWILNIAIVWFATGFWHGAAFNFILWGLYFALFLVIEKLWLRKWLDKLRIFSHIYLLFIIIISFIIFNFTSLSEGFSCIGMLFGFNGIPLYNAFSVYCLRNYIVIIVAAIIGSTSLPGRIVAKIKEVSFIKAIFPLMEIIFVMAIFVIVTAFLVNGSYNPFLYFRF